jgi:hypothetical protein
MSFDLWILHMFWNTAIQSLLHFFREFEAYYPELLHSCYVVNGTELHDAQ